MDDSKVFMFPNYNVSEKGEQAAYLIGYIAMKMFKVFNKLL